VRHWLCGVALAALVAAGCGSSPPSTKLRIEIGNASSAGVYRLTCSPAGGTVRQARAICQALARNPSLLVGGGGLDHSCPASDVAVYRVSGSYRGHRVDATFGNQSCGWVPGQGDGYAEWASLLTNPGRGLAEREFAPVSLTAPQQARRHERYVRRGNLSRAAQRLSRRRQARLVAGTLRLVAGTPPDALARRVLALRLEAGSLPNGPFPGSVKVYSTTRGRAGSVGAANDLTRSRVEPIYVLLVRYSYRDYESRSHLDPPLGRSCDGRPDARRHRDRLRQQLESASARFADAASSDGRHVAPAWASVHERRPDPLVTAISPRRRFPCRDAIHASGRERTRTKEHG
jgi:hypothetical protein